MKSELTEEFINRFRNLPDRVQKNARKNYQLWKHNYSHPSLEFKKLKGNREIYSVRVGIGW